MNLSFNLNNAFNAGENLSLENQELSEALLCNIVEISENTNFKIPSFPIDNGEVIADTIIDLNNILNCRVFVLSDNIVFFEKSLKNLQNSSEFFKITSLYSKSYDNLKLLGWSADTNSQMVGGRHYTLTLQELVLVEALVTPANMSNASYSSKQTLGTKQSESQLDTPQKKSALLTSKEWLGGR